ncbi:hypothetical protein HN51_016503 [Arachis hypogaea]|uniref:Pentatricopeptide repeat-containing protein n=1 Tax=Arachis hypogaea TaxID=3818 RepID=A0A445CTA9_ARAHY|nr:pentatricopeptide repeat-containing protein At3g26630, chloroplastic [Arachis hypogaea]QHO47084.1 Pentatricopeptide repeat-containing protein [Arachis hypogaea]RYR54105.1 hypothetical protein Ahy_A06g029367 isoform B [Arachis hypogaea]
MKVACFCTPDINYVYFGTQRPKFGSKEALFYLQRCSNFKHLRQVHGRIIRYGLTHDQLLIRNLIQISSSYGKLNYAKLVFEQLNSPDTFTWNVMIRAYTRFGSPEKALILFTIMVSKGIELDKFTYPFVINACIVSSATDFGKVVQALAIKMGFWNDTYVQNTMMNLYFKCEDADNGHKVFDKMRVQEVVSWTTAIGGLVACGRLEAARRLFEEMPSKNVVSWTAMIDGYVRHQQPMEAFDLFERMRLDGVQPNEFTLVSLIKACAEMGSLKLGKWIHDYAFNNDFKLDPFLGTALIDMYSKCGSLDDARQVFDTMEAKNLATWNTMITSLGVHGLRNEALELFEEMLNNKSNEVPDAITFVGVLNACLQLNDLEQGQKYFNLMTQHYGITPLLEHYACMVQLYRNANVLDDIYTLDKTISVEKTNNYVAEFLQENKIIGVDDIEELLQKHYRYLNCLEEQVVDNFSSSSSP